MGEDDLLRQIAGGEEAAFETFYRLYESRLYGYLLTLVRDHASAEDLVIDVMVAVWQGAARFRGTAQVSTWLFSIARNKAIDRIRVKPLPLPMPPFPTGHPRADERNESIRLCLQMLSLEHREVLELAFFQGYSYQEIADLVGCPVGTVGTRILHAKRQLKRCLEHQDLFAEDI
jgi:RNA polymerase sigma-70 factor (ECF subfamily)